MCHALAGVLTAIAMDGMAAELSAGDFDPQFGDPGLRLGFTPVPSALGAEAWFPYELRSFAPRLASDGEGRWLVLGERCDGAACGLALTRFTANGALDTSYADDDHVVTVDGAQAESASLAVDEAGRAWLAYVMPGVPAVLTVARYTASGVLDAGFGTGGRVNFTAGHAFDDAYLALRGATPYLARLQRSADTAPAVVELLRFDETGVDATFPLVQAAVPLYALWDMAIDRQGRIVVLGTDYEFVDHVLRFAADGSGLDAGFGVGGGLESYSLLDGIPGWRDKVDAGEAFYAGFQALALTDDDGLLLLGVLSAGLESAFVVHTDAAGAARLDYGAAGGWFVDDRSYVAHGIAWLVEDDGGLTLAMSNDPELDQPLSLLRLTADGDVDPGPTPASPLATVYGMRRDAAGGTVALGRLGKELGEVAGLMRHLGPAETRTVDQSPDNFGFVPELQAQRGVLVVQAPFEVAGVDTATPVRVDGGFFAVDGGERIFDSRPHYVKPGASITFGARAPSGHGQVLDARLSVGDLTRTFHIETRDELPDPIVVPPVTAAAAGATVVSEPVQITGITVPISIFRVLAPDNPLDLEFSVNGGDFQSAVSVRDGDVLRLRLGAAANPGETRTARFTTTYLPFDEHYAFSVTTRVEPSADPPSGTSGGGAWDGWFLLLVALRWVGRRRAV